MLTKLYEILNQLRDVSLEEIDAALDSLDQQKFVLTSLRQFKRCMTDEKFDLTRWTEPLVEMTVAVPDLKRIPEQLERFLAAPANGKPKPKPKPAPVRVAPELEETLVDELDLEMETRPAPELSGEALHTDHDIPQLPALESVDPFEELEEPDDLSDGHYAVDLKQQKVRFAEFLPHIVQVLNMPMALTLRVIIRRLNMPRNTVVGFLTGDRLRPYVRRSSHGHYTLTDKGRRMAIDLKSKMIPS